MEKEQAAMRIGDNVTEAGPANQGNEGPAVSKEIEEKSEKEASLFQLELSIVITTLVIFLMTCCYLLYVGK